MKPESHDQRSCCVVPRPSVLRAGRAHVWPLGYALEVRLTSLVCALEKAHPFVQPNFERRHFEIHLVYFHSPPHFHELPHPQKPKLPSVDLNNYNRHLLMDIFELY